MNPIHPNDPKGEAGSKKTPLQLLPPYALAQTALAHAEGARRYGPWNWRTNKVCATTYIGAILRHLTAWQDGEDIDADSGLSHIAKIGACCNILLDAGHCGTLVDDRSKVPSKMTVEQVKEMMDLLSKSLPAIGSWKDMESAKAVIQKMVEEGSARFVEPASEEIKEITPIPPGLPPLPPVPEGFLRWEYRGMGWVADMASYSCISPGGTDWAPWGTTAAGGYRDTHYIEAVK